MITSIAEPTRSGKQKWNFAEPTRSGKQKWNFTEGNDL
jgi:hypothetical protein